MSETPRDDLARPALSMDRETFLAHAEGSLPAVVRVAATLEIDATPLSAYAALSGKGAAGDRSDYAFLLESAEKTAGSDPDGAFQPSATHDRADDRHARYSFVGYDPAGVVTIEAASASVDEASASVDGASTSVEQLDDSAAARVLADAQTAATGETGTADSLDALRSAMPDVRQAGFPERDRQSLDGGFVGFLTYDAVYDCWLEEVGVTRPESRFPDAQFVLTTKTVVFDHVEESVEVVFTPLVDDQTDPAAVYDALQEEADRVTAVLSDANAPASDGIRVDRERAGSQEDYEDAVRRAKAYVEDGDMYQCVVSRKRELFGDVDPLGLYAALRAENPSPYMYLLSQGDLSVVGASPETLVSVSSNRVTANPIAGTCPRGSSPVEDRRLAGEMLADDKERAEHTMLVDLARNDVRRVAKAGSVRVDEFMAVLKYSHVQHIESTVTATLADDADAFDAIRATFPAGTLAGAPKVRAMERIHELETDPRGLYGGGVGYVSWAGDADLAIVIRTATVEHGPDEDRLTAQAGAGIVADSDPTAEFEETEAKLAGVLAAVDRTRTDGQGTEPPESMDDQRKPTPEVSR